MPPGRGKAAGNGARESGKTMTESLKYDKILLLSCPGPDRRKAGPGSMKKGETA